MQIKDSTIMVIGGWGLVGAAMCRKIMEFNPKKIVVTSLKQSEAEEAVADLRAEYPACDPGMFEPWWGNIFTRTEWKDMPREELLVNDASRSGLIHDVIDELDDRILSESALYSLLQQSKPDAVIDCVNTATAIAYQDIYSSSRSILGELEAGGTERETVERLLASLYIPQLTRHIQVLYRGLKDAQTTTYIKVGTSGTGGMGLNIPYTHSEEQPSRILLAKSAVAGAQTLLLFLMARTPNGTLVKEIKPSAAIAWKKIGYGDVMRKGKTIPLVDMVPENAMSLASGTFSLKAVEGVKDFGENFKSVFIDTGENGIFSRAEFETISALGQMELVTPEEIADAVVNELRGGNSGLDVIGALDASVMGPTYRGGILRNTALDQLKELEKENGADSVAFEMLGPPRLSKLLYEAYILKRIAVDFESAIAMSPEDLAKKSEMLITSDATLRAQMLSVGLVIMLPDGVSYLRGNDVKIPPYRGQIELEVNPENTEKWCAEGWVDLRVENFVGWQERLKRIMEETAMLPQFDTSSRFTYTKNYWEHFQTIDGGKLAAWIFEVEEQGVEIQKISSQESRNRVMLAIMASGRGSNAEAIIQYSLTTSAAFKVALIVTNNPKSGVVEIAQQYGIEWCCVDLKDFQAAAEYEEYLLETFRNYSISMIALAGYLKLIPVRIIDAFPKKIFNIHPSLLPKYGGNGMYGMRVHKKVIENREQKSGSSVHIVERDYDTGEILCQKSIEVHDDDTPETLSERVLQVEYLIYAPTLNLQAEQLLQGI